MVHVTGADSRAVGPNLATNSGLSVLGQQDVPTRPESSDSQSDPMPDWMAGLRVMTLTATHMAEDARLSLKGMYVQCLIDGLPDDLSAEQRAHTEAVIKAWSNVFSSLEYDIGHTSILLHRIDTGDNPQHFEQLQCHPTTQLPLIDERVENMLRHDVIKPATSPWCSSVVLIRKHDGTM